MGGLNNVIANMLYDQNGDPQILTINALGRNNPNDVVTIIFNIQNISKEDDDKQLEGNKCSSENNPLKEYPLDQFPGSFQSIDLSCINSFPIK